MIYWLVSFFIRHKVLTKIVTKGHTTSWTKRVQTDVLQMLKQKLINRMILDNYYNTNKYFSTSWIVMYPFLYHKVFKHIQVIIRGHLFHQTKYVDMEHNSHINGLKSSGEIRINRGIFQGDFLSLLLFCISLIALNSKFNRTEYGYRVSQKKISRLLYMDELGHI